jgi:hypothetical protein
MIINECGAAGGMTIGRGNQSTPRKPPQCHFIHHKFHKTWCGIQHRLLCMGDHVMVAMGVRMLDTPWMYRIKRNGTFKMILALDSYYVLYQ